MHPRESRPDPPPTHKPLLHRILAPAADLSIEPTSPPPLVQTVPNGPSTGGPSTTAVQTDRLAGT